MKRLSFALTLLALAGSALAAGGGAALDRAAVDVSNTASLQRGAQLYVNYCMGCHSLQYMRYNRMMEDLELTEAQVEENFIFDGGKITDMMVNSMADKDGEEWFGAAPPDLSLTARSRGVDWIYTYLRSFYPDESRPVGWNNTVFANASMPNVLWELQGIRKPVYETSVDEAGNEHKTLVGWEQVREGEMSEAEFEQAMRDLTAFLEYVGEPAKLKREAIGVWVLLYLALFTFLAYLLKLEFWRDVH